MTPTPITAIASYHAHIYYQDAAERARAADLRDAIAAHFAVQLGRWHDQPIGPHERGMYQIAFTTPLFASFVPWLMLNRQDLTILVHPNTENPRRDHLTHALWMGKILQIVHPEQLPETLNGEKHEQIISNTTSDDQI